TGTGPYRPERTIRRLYITRKHIGPGWCRTPRVAWWRVHAKGQLIEPPFSAPAQSGQGRPRHSALRLRQLNAVAALDYRHPQGVRTRQEVVGIEACGDQLVVVEGTAIALTDTCQRGAPHLPAPVRQPRQHEIGHAARIHGAWTALGILHHIGDDGLVVMNRRIEPLGIA